METNYVRAAAGSLGDILGDEEWAESTKHRAIGSVKLKLAKTGNSLTEVSTSTRVSGFGFHWKRRYCRSINRTVYRTELRTDRLIPHS